MSTLATILLAQIEAATRARDFGVVRQTLARCATAVMEGEFEAGEAGLILLAAREANRAMRDAGRRAELIVKGATAAETKRRADQARVILASDEFKRLDDRDWTTQLLAAGNTQKGHTRKGR
jgi:hypothetical protein